MTGRGQTRSFGDVGSMSGLPKSGHDWAIYEYTRKLDAARRSRALTRASSTARPGRRRYWRGTADAGGGSADLLAGRRHVGHLHSKSITSPTIKSRGPPWRPTILRPYRSH